ncbi:hypothetical protein [Streptomyces sp. x-19]|uniref:hypothetical protein n=1 Tax=Streptomyces sp. x-19 TaxID=2789280 RepID=UPI00397FF709
MAVLTGAFGLGEGDQGGGGGARGLLLPGPDDGMWRKVPLHLREQIALQLTGAARAVAGDLRRAAALLPGEHPARVLAEYVLETTGRRLSGGLLDPKQLVTSSPNAVGAQAGEQLSTGAWHGTEVPTA